MAEFATQTADQYYSMMTIAKATWFVDIGSTRERVRDETIDARNDNRNQPQYAVMGQYTVDILPNETILLKCTKANKHVEKVGLDERLVGVMKQIARESISNRIVGYTRAIVYGDEGEMNKYNAHPFYHGAE